MTIKTVLYIFITPLIIWAFESINIKDLFKKNRYYQARMVFLFLSLGLSYLVVNFFYDFFISSRFI